MKDFPVLLKKTSTDSIQMWRIYVTDKTSEAFIFTDYGRLHGKLQQSCERISEGKNLGKSNETTYLEQAYLEAESQWNAKKKKGYVENIDDAKSGTVDSTVIEGGIFPMLAHKFSEQAAKITYPAFTQPKLDGHRCIAVCVDGSCTLWSRTRKPILGVPHVARAVERLFPTGTVVLDGELYNHDYKDKFRELSSFIRQTTPKPGHEVVEYWVYDVVNDKPFSERSKFIALEVGRKEPKIKTVETAVVGDEAQLMDLFAMFLDEGFEGSMVRNENSKYVNKRSYDLQKIKEFDDAEFEVVDVVPGTGKMEDKGVFVCKTEAGDEFKAKMVGPLDELRKYLDHKETYIGQRLTVKFQGWNTKNNVPRFGVAMRIREDV